MALTPCMSCLKQCGYLCGGLAALNIWFWIGMTIFNAMDNKWIKKEVLLLESYEADTSRYTTVFAVCIGVSIKFFFNFLTCANEDVNWDVVEHSLLYWMLRVHFIKVLSGQGCGWVLHGWWRCSCQQRVQEINSERFWCCRWRTSWFGATRRRQAHQMKPKASPLSLVEIRDYQMPDIAVSLT